MQSIHPLLQTSFVWPHIYLWYIKHLKTNSRKNLIVIFFFSKMHLFPQRAVVRHCTSSTSSFPETASVAEHQNRQGALCHRAAVARLVLWQQQNTRLTFSLEAHVLLGRNTMEGGGWVTDKASSLLNEVKEFSAHLLAKASGWAQNIYRWVSQRKVTSERSGLDTARTSPSSLASYQRFYILTQTRKVFHPPRRRRHKKLNVPAK